MAVVGCVIMPVACFCPMVLFRLLAFVDPGTGSGASFRSTLAANGGVGGLLGGRRRAADQGSGAATQTAADGRAASEDAADAETANRFQSRFAQVVGAVGGGRRRRDGRRRRVAQPGASMGVDVVGQAGVGTQGYYDTTPPAAAGRATQDRTRTGDAQADGRDR